MARGGDCQDEFVEINVAVVVSVKRRERVSKRNECTGRTIDRSFGVLLAERIGFALRIELSVDFHELLLVQSTGRTVVNETLNAPHGNRAVVDKRAYRVPLADLYKRWKATHDQLLRDVLTHQLPCISCSLAALRFLRGEKTAMLTDRQEGSPSYPSGLVGSMLSRLSSHLCCP